jgi:uncharacterized protein (DUF488 family)
MSVAAGILYSIGHGSRAPEDFLGLLERHRIDCLVDVRAYPASRRHPQYARLALEAALTAKGVRYVWEGTALGGMRRPRADSPHLALADAAFRGYADHMGTPEFAAGIARLVALGARHRVAFMCAETMPEHCHRAFIADALVACGVEVHHLVGPDDTRRHAVNPAARQGEGAMIYDGGRQLTLQL